MTPAKIYLLAYNGVSAIGWAYLLVINLQCLFTGKWDSTYYAKIGLTLKICQSMAVLEILHAFARLVKSNPMVTTVQVFSRLFLVWGIVHSVPQASRAFGFPIAVTAWCFAEIVRYTFYACSLFGSIPYVVLWLRYTMFIVLYPVGVAGELLTMYTALTPIKNGRVYSVSMPNKCNMSFDYHYCVIFIMLLYLPGFPQLYCHMFAQRKKTLNTDATKLKEKVT